MVKAYTEMAQIMSSVASITPATEVSPSGSNQGLFREMVANPINDAKQGLATADKATMDLAAGIGDERDDILKLKTAELDLEKIINVTSTSIEAIKTLVNTPL